MTTGRVIIVTGASSGIGRSAAVALGRSGHTVVLAARRRQELTEVADEIAAYGGTAHTVPTDLDDPAAIDSLVREAASRAGRIDVLINCAGISGAPSQVADDAYTQLMININLLAPIRLIRAVVPVMIRLGGGKIINIGSVAGEIGSRGIYSATKFGLRGMNDTARRELAPLGINVTLIEPGFIATPLTTGRAAHMPGPEVVVAAIEKALRRPRRRLIVPWRYALPVALAQLAPALADRILQRGEIKRSFH